MARLKRKNLDFIRASRRKAGNEYCALSKTAVVWGLPGILLLAMMGYGMLRWNQIGRMERQIREISEYIDRKDIRELDGRATAVWERFQFLDLYLANSERVKDWLENEPQADGELLRLLTDSGGVMLRELSMADRELKITAEVADYNEIEPYIKMLEESERFESVAYTGFEHQGLYRFSAFCRMKDAIRKDEVQP